MNATFKTVMLWMSLLVVVSVLCLFGMGGEFLPPFN